MNNHVTPWKRGQDGLVREIARLLENNNPLLVALDGRSGTGKSMIANATAGRVGGVIVTSDDFYSGGDDADWAGLTAKDKVDRVIDWRRMRTQALEPLLAKTQAHWHPLDFEPGVGWVGWKEETVKLQAASVIILDGVYSARPELSDLAGLAVLVETGEEQRRQRLVTREGQNFMRRWHKIWDPAEDYYFSHVRVPSTFDIVVRND